MQWSVHNRVHLPPSDLECGTCFLQHVSIQGYFSMITCRSIFIGCLTKQIILSSPVQHLAHSDREQKTLRYAIFKASGVSQTEARRRYGFEGMNERAANVEKAIADVEEIREAIEGLARIQDKALLQTLGIVEVVSSSDEPHSD